MTSHPWRVGLLAGLTLLLSLPALPANGQRLRERLAQRQTEAATLPAPAGMQVRHDLAYGSDPRQRFDVYLPARPQAAPLLVMVHGGGWRRGDKASSGVVANKVAHWLPQGFIVVSVDYRLLPEADPLTQAADVAAALARIQALAPDWGGDPRATVLVGHSSGGHLVSLLDADPSLLRAAGARPPQVAVALDSAVMNVPQLMAAPRHLALYDRAFGKRRNDWLAASPYHRLQAGAAPLLIVCSTRREDACPQGQALAAKAAGLGVVMDVLPQDLSHAEINQRLGLPSAYTTAVDRFIATHLRRSVGRR